MLNILNDELHENVESGSDIMLTDIKKETLEGVKKCHALVLTIIFIIITKIELFNAILDNCLMELLKIIFLIELLPPHYF